MARPKHSATQIQYPTSRANKIAIAIRGNIKSASLAFWLIERKHFMRSDLIFGALTHVTNRYELCQLASKATRKLHKPNTRLQDTTNEVLDRFKDTVPMDAAAAPGVHNVSLQEQIGRASCRERV